MPAVRKECERLRRETGRLQALVRASQRTVGLAMPEKTAAGGAAGAAGRKRRRRKPVVRALRAAAMLTAEAPTPPAAETA